MKNTWPYIQSGLGIGIGLGIISLSIAVFLGTTWFTDNWNWIKETFALLAGIWFLLDFYELIINKESSWKIVGKYGIYYYFVIIGWIGWILLILGIGGIDIPPEINTWIGIPEGQNFQIIHFVKVSFSATIDALQMILVGLVPIFAWKIIRPQNKKA